MPSSLSLAAVIVTITAASVSLLETTDSKQHAQRSATDGGIGGGVRWVPIMERRREDGVGSGHSTAAGGGASRENDQLGAIVADVLAQKSFTEKATAEKVQRIGKMLNNSWDMQKREREQGEQLLNGRRYGGDRSVSTARRHSLTSVFALTMIVVILGFIGELFIGWQL